MHTQVSGGARSVHFSLNFYLRPYFVFASIEGSGESAHLGSRARAFDARPAIVEVKVSFTDLSIGDILVLSVHIQK